MALRFTDDHFNKSYKQTIGLDFFIKQLVLPGVLHSINEAGTTLPTDRWYGSEGIVDQWLPAVREATSKSSNPLEEAGRKFAAMVSREFGAPADLE